MQPICKGLSKAGFAYSHTPEAMKPVTNTVAIFSREPITTTDHYLDNKGTVRCSEAVLANDGTRIIAVSFPHKKEQIPLFETLLALSEDYRSTSTIIIGDFNCGIPFEDSETKTFYATHLFQALQKQGWIDSWRSRNPKAREYTWFSTQKGNGFRYDHALSSTIFDQSIKKISYDHSVREQGVSDHSLLVVES